MLDVSANVVARLGLPRFFDSAAALDAASDLAAAGLHEAVAASNLSAEATLTAAGILVARATVAASAESDLAATGITEAVAAAALSAESVLTATGTRIVFGSSMSVGPSELTVAAVRVQPAAASATGSSNATAVGLVEALAAAALAASTDATAAAVLVLPVAVEAMSAESNVADVEALPIYRLNAGTFEQTYTNNILMGRFGIDTGFSVIVKDNTVTVTDYPDTFTLEQADAYYLGGRHYQLNQSQYEAFVAAGRTDLIEVA